MPEIETAGHKLREVIKKYFEVGPREIQEFFYSYDKKQYSADMVNPKLM